MSEDRFLTITIDREDMARRGRIGAHVTNSRYDARELTAPARAAFRARFVAEAVTYATNRGETISEAEAERRGESARKAHYARMARASVLARRRPAAREEASPVSETSGEASAEGHWHDRPDAV